ncbi:hypothetical protein M3P21_17655 [Ruegeria sp. 2012CJ41-6]|uniref:DUF995 domain-containing protein n=1 Tax=Ruegeria spongiae TaxID=2942209 RepID=A0ABT0Q670_9RHOB|nr:hypothetical protein [Ruegeria spongiae]MCL6285359.1 hypothetical protein [Ruegeria spongiae]
MFAFKPVLLASAMIVAAASAAQAQAFMTQKEILATIPGSTAYGIANSDGKTQWAQAYGKGRKKGKIAGNFGGDAYEAKWFVDGNQWCEDWGSGSGCFQFVRISEKELQPYKNGQKQKHIWKLK